MLNLGINNSIIHNLDIKYEIKIDNKDILLINHGKEK